MGMPATKKIALYDTVELVEAADRAPAGERGVVVEILDGGTAMIELKTPPARLDLDRVVVAPFTKLRVLDSETC
jgi:hypothetical protein